MENTNLIAIIDEANGHVRYTPLQEFANYLPDIMPSTPGSYTDEEARDAVAAALIEGVGIDIVYNDGADTITISCTITQYTDGMADVRAAAAIVTHEGLADPHPGYLTPAEGNAAYSAIGHDHDADYEALGAVASAISAHEAAGNPHPVYLTQAEGDALYAAITVTQYTDEMVDDRVAVLVVEGAGIDVAYNDGAGTFTITVDLSELSTTTLPEGSNLYYTNERVDDRVAALLVEGANITLTYDDGANTLTIDAASGSGNFGVAVADFGAFPGAQRVSVTVSGQSGLISTTKIQAWLQPIATSDHNLDDHLCEEQFLNVKAYYSVDGSFAIEVETCNPPQTRYPPSRQGDKYRVWDEFSIGWSWAN